MDARSEEEWTGWIPHQAVVVHQVSADIYVDGGLDAQSDGFVARVALAPPLVVSFAHSPPGHSCFRGGLGSTRMVIIRGA